MGRKNLAFTRKDLANWRAEMSNLRPGPMTAGPFLNLFNVCSMKLGETPTGLILRLANSHGQTVDTFINPAVAEALLAAVRAGGQAAGWLDATGRIIDPPPDLPPNGRHPNASK